MPDRSPTDRGPAGPGAPRPGRAGRGPAHRDDSPRPGRRVDHPATRIGARGRSRRSTAPVSSVSSVAPLPVTVWLLDPRPPSPAAVREVLHGRLLATLTTGSATPSRRTPRPDPNDELDNATSLIDTPLIDTEAAGPTGGPRPGTSDGHASGTAAVALGGDPTGPLGVTRRGPEDDGSVLPSGGELRRSVGASRSAFLGAAADDEAVALVLLDPGSGLVSAPALARVTAGLGPHTVLAVLTHRHRDRGTLVDPRPALVIAATSVGLDHLQHIVTITRHHSTGGEPGDWCLGPDISLFRRHPAPAHRPRGDRR